MGSSAEAERRVGKQKRGLGAAREGGGKTAVSLLGMAGVLFAPSKTSRNN